MALLSRYKAMEKENIGLSNESETKTNLCKFCEDMFPGTIDIHSGVSGHVETVVPLSRVQSAKFVQTKTKAG